MVARPTIRLINVFVIGASGAAMQVKMRKPPVGSNGLRTPN